MGKSNSSSVRQSEPDYWTYPLFGSNDLNAAITAYNVQRELMVPPVSRTGVVCGVFDLVVQHVRSQLTGSSRHDQVGHQTHHQLVLLVHGMSPHLDDSLVGSRLRRPDLDHFGYDAERVAWPHGPRPFELLSSGAD